MDTSPSWCQTKKSGETGTEATSDCTGDEKSVAIILRQSTQYGPVVDETEAQIFLPSKLKVSNFRLCRLSATKKVNPFFTNLSKRIY